MKYGKIIGSFAVVAATCEVAACDAEVRDLGAGDSGAGGSFTSTGGTSSGGKSGSGGSSSSGGSSGGGSGGSVASGGASSGGSFASGGTSTGGSSDGGSGGSVDGGSSGGTVGSGGTVATGGTSSGGAIGSGGAGTGGTPVPCSGAGLNQCQGCGVLAGTPGAACGACGKWTCNQAKTNVTCEPTPACTFCQTQSAPSGVAATDYRCADFDKGMPASTEWKTIKVDGGEINTTTAVAFSSPNSLFTKVLDDDGTGTSDRALLTWDVVGATPIKSVTISAQINMVDVGGVPPPWDGWVDVMCVQSGPDEFCLAYSLGGAPAPTKQGNGFFLHWQYARGAAIAGTVPFTGEARPSTSVWHKVDFTVGKGIGMTVSIDGTNVVTAQQGLSDDTTASVHVGMDTVPYVSFITQMRFDNVVAVVRR